MSTDSDVMARILAAEAEALNHFKWLPFVTPSGDVLWKDPSNKELVSQSNAVARLKARYTRAAMPTLDEVRR